MKQRPKPVFQECSSNLSAVDPVLSTDVPGTSTENQFKRNFEIRYDCMPGFTFPCNENAREISESFPLTDIKMTLHLQHRVGHASSDTPRHRLMHLMQCC